MFNSFFSLNLILPVSQFPFLRLIISVTKEEYIEESSSDDDSEVSEKDVAEIDIADNKPKIALPESKIAPPGASWQPPRRPAPPAKKFRRPRLQST